MSLVHVEVEKNLKNVVDNKRKFTTERSTYMEDIYLDRERLHEIKEMVKELGVSL